MKSSCLHLQKPPCSICGKTGGVSLFLLLCANDVLSAPRSDAPEWFQRAREESEETSNSKAMMTFFATGGIDAAPCEYKGAVFLYNTDRTRICGGSLIDEIHVLTAHHCTLGIAAHDLEVHMGNWNIYNWDVGEQIRLVTSVSNHNLYDVSIMELDRPVHSNDCVEPTLLYNARPVVTRPLMVVGWGLTEANSWHVAEDLQQVMVPVVDSQTCITDIQSYDPSESINDYEFCAGSSTGPYRNICAGDSGGGIYDWLDNYGWVVVGIAVRGMGAQVVGCPEEGHYAIFLGLDVLVEWIEANSNTSVEREPTPPPPPPPRQPSGGGGCFSGMSTVELKSGERRSISTIVPGDEVLAMDNSGNLRFSTVITMLHAEQSISVEYYSLHTTSGKRLLVSEYHLVYTADCSSSTVSYSDYKYAKNLQVGDCVRVRVNSHDDDETDAASEMQEITEIYKQTLDDAYAPLTTLGTLVVDDVAASCYASISYHGLGQLAFAPLQYLYPLLPEVFLAQQNVSENTMVQWYPNLLVKGVWPAMQTLQPFFSN